MMITSSPTGLAASVETSRHEQPRHSRKSRTLQYS